MQDQNSSKIRDIIYEKYGFYIEPSIEGPFILMDENLTVGEFIKAQNELKNEIERAEIGLDLDRAIKVLGGPPFQKIPISSIFYYNWGWTITLIISIISFFLNWIYGVVFVIATIKEFLAPFNRKILRTNIIKVSLNDYEALYLLMCTRSISIREFRDKNKFP